MGGVEAFAITLGKMGIEQTDGREEQKKNKKVCRGEVAKMKRPNKKYIERSDSRQIFSVHDKEK